MSFNLNKVLGTMRPATRVLLIFLFVCGALITNYEASPQTPNQRRLPPNGGMFGKRSIGPILMGKDSMDDNGSLAWPFQYPTRYELFLRGAMNNCVQDQRDLGKFDYVNS